jgi:hypothetical protein
VPPDPRSQKPFCFAALSIVTPASLTWWPIISSDAPVTAWMSVAGRSAPRGASVPLVRTGVSAAPGAAVDLAAHP